MGVPALVGTSIEVAVIATEKIVNGLEPDEIAAHYNLSLAQVYAALAYYYDHKEAVDADIKDRLKIVDQIQGANPSDQSADILPSAEPSSSDDPLLGLAGQLESSYSDIDFHHDQSISLNLKEEHSGKDFLMSIAPLGEAEEDLSERDEEILKGEIGRKKLSVFRYVEELDAFLITDEYRKIADQLGLTEWHSAVWIGRLFTMDNDFGEHWMDNWHLREEREAAANSLGIEADKLMIIDPDRFKDDRDGPCHSALSRKNFWADVLKSLELSHDLLFEVAREINQKNKIGFLPNYMEDLEVKIAQLQRDTFD